MKRIRTSSDNAGKQNNAKAYPRQSKVEQQFKVVQDLIFLSNFIKKKQQTLLDSKVPPMEPKQ